jgi:integrase
MVRQSGPRNRPARAAARDVEEGPAIDVDAELLSEPQTPLTALIPHPGGALVLTKNEERRQHYAKAARAKSTRLAYAGDWSRFLAWAAPQGLSTLPTSPRTVGQYIAHLADEGLSCSTVDRVIASIGYYHRQGGFEWYPGHPDIARPREGIRREIGVRRTKKAAFTDELLVRAVEHLRGPRTTMHRAILTTAFWAGLRRGEVVGLLEKHVHFEIVDGVDWLIVFLPTRKTDQQRQGTEVGMCAQPDERVCPVRAMRAWLAERAASERVFPCSDRSVARLVQRLAGAIGQRASSFGGHSLRAGFATTAEQRGVRRSDWMRQTGHTSDKIAAGYVRHADIFKNNATATMARTSKRGKEPDK